MARAEDDRRADGAGGGLTDDDAALWRKVSSGVRRLPKDRRQTPVPERPERREPASDDAPRQSSPTPAAKPRPRPAAPAPELRHDAAPGLDRRTFEKLRRGRIAIDGRLDLHGCYQEEAHRRLIGYLAAAQTAGRRCVLVITGKGSRDGTGVLRASVPRWLNEAPLRERVLAFSHAAPADGGAGALYVLLKRAR